MKTYSYLPPVSKSVVIVEYYCQQSNEPFRFRRINIDANKMSTAAETPNYKRIAELIKPDKHLCIKCKQHIARSGLICDQSSAYLDYLTKEMAAYSTGNKQPTADDTWFDTYSIWLY